MALISPILGEHIPVNSQEYYSSRGERPIYQRVEDNPSSRQAASDRSKRRPGSDRANDTTSTRQVSISDAKDEEISTNIATNHIHRFTTTVQKCESKLLNCQTNSNQQNIVKKPLTNSAKSCLNLKCHTSNRTVKQDLCYVGKKGTRSRHSLFYLDTFSDKQTYHFRHQHRDREPSRISVKKLRRK